MYASAGVKRGCGTRVKGGVYWEVGLSEYGSPLESFIIDPPMVVDIDALGISPRGVHVIERNGVAHVFDWIGAESYPNVADFLEEARRFGVSRRLELPKEQYNRLTPESRLVLVHPKAHIKNPEPYWYPRVGMQNEAMPTPYKWHLCPKELPEHEEPETMCAGLWWEDVIDASPVEKGERIAMRKMPSFSYGCAIPPETAEHFYLPAVFASFPLGRIVVINDPDEGTHEKALDRLSGLQDRFQIDVEDE